MSARVINRAALVRVVLFMAVMDTLCWLVIR
jgi:hypothetical protein